MSYILDALRKSEQERLASGLPNLHSGQAAAVEIARPQRNWLVLVGIALVINAAALVWWLAARPGAAAHAPAAPVLAPTPSQPQKPAATAPTPSVPMASTTAVEESAPPPSAVARVEPPPPAGPAQPSMAPAQPDPTLAARPSRPRLAADAASAARGATPSQANPAQQASPTHPPSASLPEPEEAPAPAPRSGIVSYADLPPSIRKALPPLQIGGYIEGAGSDAMLIVDDRLVHEGDEIGAGVRVVKIAPDGAVFSFRNYRFRR